jgi:large subunit ribosomal protein L35
MPKLKTKKSIAKRFHFTKKGKIKYSRAFRSHILTKKSRKRKRYLGTADFVSKVEKQKIRRFLPYGES